MANESEQFKKAKEYAFLLLKFRPRSINEFKEKLKRHGYSEEITDELIKDFKKRGLLDDSKFAKLWIEDRMHIKPMGKLKLKLELEGKGINEEDINGAFDKLSADTNEYETAKGLAQKRLGQLGNLDRITIKRRIFEFLKRRGFSYDVVVRVTREVLDNESRCNS